MSRIFILTFRTFEEFFLKKYIVGALILGLVFAIISVKVKNIELGYEINTLKERKKEKKIALEKLEMKLSKIKSVNVLSDKGEKLGLELPESGQIFYVE